MHFVPATLFAFIENAKNACASRLPIVQSCNLQ